MPHRSGNLYSQQNYAARSGSARLRAAAAQTGADFAFVHAGRQLRVGPIAFWVVVGTLVIMAVWTLATATYFTFREDVLTRLIARETEMQFAYEDRIAEITAEQPAILIDHRKRVEIHIIGAFEKTQWQSDPEFFRQRCEFADQRIAFEWPCQREMTRGLVLAKIRCFEQFRQQHDIRSLSRGATRAGEEL